MTELRTSRLHLIAATLEMAHAEVHDRAALATLLEARLPGDWPPPLNDAASARFFLEYLTTHPTATGWMTWYFVAVDENGERVVIGNGGFKGTPFDGSVEVGYSILPSYQRQGFATEAVGALIDWAFAQDSARRVWAQTLPGRHASQTLLRKLGFREMLPAEPGVLRFELEERSPRGPVAQR